MSDNPNKWIAQGAENGTSRTQPMMLDGTQAPGVCILLKGVGFRPRASNLKGERYNPSIHLRKVDNK